MSEGILGLFGVALGAALLDFLLPGKESSGVRGAMRFLTALAVLSLLLSPFISMLDSVESTLSGDVISGEEVDRAAFEACFEETVNTRGAAECEALLLKYLEAELEIDASAFEVVLELDEDGALSCVRVFLSGEALLVDPEAVESVLGEKLNCEVEVR